MSSQKRQLKKSESTRDLAKRGDATPKARRIRRTAGALNKSLKSAGRRGNKEIYLPLPDNRAGRFLNKRRRLLPRFFGDAWKELKQVVWPGRSETVKLTFAVFIFALAFGSVIYVVDLGLEKIFRKVLLQ